MAISIDGMLGYIRTRPKRGTGARVGPDGRPAPELELWIDPQIVLTPTATGPVVGTPADCAGVLYSAPGGKLEVRYPE